MRRLYHRTGLIGHYHWWIFYKDSGAPPLAKNQPVGRNWVKNHKKKIATFSPKVLFLLNFYHYIPNILPNYPELSIFITNCPKIWKFEFKNAKNFFGKKWKLLLRSLAKDRLLCKIFTSDKDPLVTGADENRALLSLVPVVCKSCLFSCNLLLKRRGGILHAEKWQFRVLRIKLIQETCIENKTKSL